MYMSCHVSSVAVAYTYATHSPDVFGEGVIVKYTVTEPQTTDVTFNWSVIPGTTAIIFCGRACVWDISHKQHYYSREGEREGERDGARASREIEREMERERAER